MSVRKRIALMFVVVFIINIVGFSLFSLELLPIGVNNRVATMKERVNSTVEDVISQLTMSDDFYQSVDVSKIGKNILIYIEDLDGNIVYSYPDSKSADKINKGSNLYVTASEKFLSTNSNGQQIYFIKAAISSNEKYSFSDIPAFMNLYLGQILMFETIVFTIAMIIIIVSVQRIFILPIEKLTKSIRGYNKNAFFDENTEKNELKSLNKDFDTLTEALNEEHRKQTRIIASVSHDIKTPLTSIMGYAEQLKKEDIPKERYNKYVNTIYDKSIAIKRLIENLDDYITYNDKADSTEKTVVSVKQLVTAIDSYYRDDLERVNCNFVIDDKTDNVSVVINKSDMLRVFGNIISNSTKHKSDNTLEILIELSQTNYEVYIKVSDNGEGVQPNQYRKIFEPLYTTDASRSKSVSGLGLSICKDIIEAHSGRIYATKSNFETGLGICIILPRADRR